jgi:hypothetical protein
LQRTLLPLIIILLIILLLKITFSSSNSNQCTSILAAAAGNGSSSGTTNGRIGIGIHRLLRRRIRVTQPTGSRGINRDRGSSFAAEDRQTGLQEIIEFFLIGQ